MRVLLAALSLLAPPAHLVDGSRPPAVPRALAGFGAVAMTRARVVPVQALPDAWRLTCLQLTSAQRGDDAVVRVGASGASVVASIRDAQLGCEGARPGPPWCGGAAAFLRVHSARMRRALDVECARRSFVFAPAAKGARWLLVRQPGWWEAYPVLGPAPVRVCALGARRPGSARAAFTILHVDARGRVLRRESFTAG